MATNPNPLSLPPEVLDQIIDYNYDDIPTLRSCALACRLFLPSCRVHLFSEVVLVHNDIINLGPQGYDIHGRLYSCENFLQLLEEAPWVAALVKVLELHGGYGRSLLTERIYMDIYLPSILSPSKLSKLNHLSLTFHPPVKWAQLSQKLQDAVEETLSRPTLTQLDLVGIDFNTPANLVAILSKARTVKHLSFTSNSMRYSSKNVNIPAIPASIPFLFQLRSLGFAGHAMHVHEVYVLSKAHPSRIDLTQVRELSVATESVAGNDAVDALQSLLDTIGSSLEHLTLGLVSSPSKSLSVDSNTNLRSVHVVCTSLEKPHHFHDIPFSSSVQTLMVDVGPGWDDDVFLAVNWQEFDSLFDSRADSLTRIVIMLHRPHDRCGERFCGGYPSIEDDLLERVEAQMPKLMARGILWVKERRVRYTFGHRWIRDLA
ncbi:uncharacterized protein EV420DRAFT_713204 [Desarmillaria tabescens]|uniref:F-box domain-containing protein n=1 Tax=Armillaria tabescens TaxID=1929756 RepID=A0AA39K0X2_ARMTA|nr:uncharacterized protein EV420DRAFT_713204 [Desarmillaria tabescens]KAK0451346.1 hypothetical protein EV420DRAFT_713204 [Desarmillaria tabescens]